MPAEPENRHREEAPTAALADVKCMSDALAELNRNHEAQERLLERLRRCSERRYPGAPASAASAESAPRTAAEVALKPASSRIGPAWARESSAQITADSEEAPHPGRDLGGEPAVWEEIGLLRARATVLLTRLEDQLSALSCPPFSRWLPTLRESLAVLAEKRQRPIRLQVEGGQNGVPAACAETLVHVLLLLLEFLLTQGFGDRSMPPADADSFRIRIEPLDHLISVDLGKELHGAGPSSGDRAPSCETPDSLGAAQRESAFRDWVRQVHRSDGFDRLTALGGSLTFGWGPTGNPIQQIRVPVWNRLVRVVLVGQGSRIYALPLAQIERAKPLDTSEKRRIETESALFLEGSFLPVFCLNRLLGGSGGPGGFLLILRQPAGRGLAVDRVLGERKALIRDLGTHLNRVAGFAGAVVLSADRLAPLLDLGALLPAGSERS